MNLALWLVPVLVAGAALCASGLFASPATGLSSSLALAALVCCLGAGRLASRRARDVAGVVWAAFSACAAIAASAPVLTALGTRFQGVPMVVAPIRAILGLLGFEAQSLGATIYAGAGHSLGFSTNWAKLGLLPGTWISLAACVLLLALDRSRPLRAAARVVVCVAGFMAVRYAFLILLALYHPDPTYESGEGGFVIGLFLNPRGQVVSFLPLALLLARFVPWSSAEVRARPIPREQRTRLAVGALLAVVAAAAAAFWASRDDSGTPKRGRILLDEHHSRSWSSALAALDTEHHGRDSVYNYTLLVRFLRQYFDVGVHVDAPYTPEVLADVDVLVLKPATTPFAADELDAIQDFVHGGGGLFVIGDHTDLLGSSTHLNALTRRFGMSFRPDACNRLEDGQAHAWTPLPWDAHPIAAHSKSIGFLTSCTLDVPPDADEVLVVRNAFSDPLDYSGFSFFGNVAPDLDDEVGLHVVCAARRVGSGRVVLFGDSTIFSSFGLTLEGRSEFLLGSIDWLDRRQDASPVAPRVAGLLALLTSLALGIVVRRPWAAFWGSLAPPAATLGLVLGTLAARELNLREHPLPPARAPMARVAFPTLGCDLELTAPLLEPRRTAEDAFDPLFTAPSRLGMLPLELQFPQALECSTLVLVRPEERVAFERARDLETFVREGGRLMVLCDEAAALRALLAPFEVEVVVSDAKAVELRSGADGAVLSTVGPLSGARVLRRGAGELIVVLRPQAFSRAGLGSQLDPLPATDPRFELHRELYALLDPDSIQTR